MEELVHHGAAGAPAVGGEGIAIEQILADIEIEGREIGVHEIWSGMEHALEVILLVAREHGRRGARASLCRM